MEVLNVSLGQVQTEIDVHSDHRSNPIIIQFLEHTGIHYTSPDEQAAIADAEACAAEAAASDARVTNLRAIQKKTRRNKKTQKIKKKQRRIG